MRSYSRATLRDTVGGKRSALVTQGGKLNIVVEEYVYTSDMVFALFAN